MEKDKGRESVQVGGRGVLVIHFFFLTCLLSSIFR